MNPFRYFPVSNAIDVHDLDPVLHKGSDIGSVDRREVINSGLVSGTPPCGQAGGDGIVRFNV